MSEFANIIDGVMNTVEALHGVSVVYAQAVGGTPIPLTATPTAIAGGVDVAEGALMTESKSRDFLIRACDLRRGNVRFTPAKGDTITDTGYVYTVMQPSTSDAPYRWHDRARRVFRVHTKETAVPA